jgi:hypothetical protein
MSQAGQLISIQDLPQIPTQFTTDSGIAIPSVNNLNVFGGVDVMTAASGDTITINVNSSSLVSSITATSPLTANGVSGTPQLGNVTMALTTPLATGFGGTGTATTFTPGSIVFAGTSGIYNQNNADLFWDNTHNRLGLIDNAPGSTLSVVGNGQIGFSSGTAAPSNSLLVRGMVGIGTSSPDPGVSSLQLSNSLTTTDGGNAYAVLWTGSFTPSTGAGGRLVGISLLGIFSAPSSQTINQAIGIYTNLDMVAGSSATITNGYGILIDGGAGSGAGTIGNVYGGFFSNPNVGTNKCALYAANAAIGSYTATTPPSNGMAVSGHVLIGTSTDDTVHNLQVTGTTIVSTSISTPIYLLTGSGSGTISILPQSASGTYNFNLPTTAGTSGYILTSAGGGSSPMTWTNPSSSFVTSITGTANQIAASASVGSVTLSLIGPYTPSTYTSHGVLVGEGTSSIVAVSPSATSGIPLISQGSSSDPIYGTAVVAGGGTGDVSFTAYSVICGGTTSTGPLQNVIGVGSSGQVLTSGGASTLPTWTSLITGVSSVTGTANQILASPTTGAVILSLIGPYTPATYTSHGVLVGQGTSSIVAVGPTSTAGQILQSTGASSDPSFSTATYPSTTTLNDILYSSSANVVGQITAANNGVLISGTTGIPSWLAAGTTGQVLVATTSNPASWGTLSSLVVTSITATSPITASASTGAVTIALTTPLAVTFGGTGTATAFTQGSVVFAGTSGVYNQNNANFFWDNSNSRLGIGTASPSSPLTVFGASTVASGELGTIQIVGTATSGPGIPRLILGINYSASAMTYGYIQSTENGINKRPLLLQPEGVSGVGIGSTTIPANMLDVSGSVAIGSYAGTAGPSNGLIVSGQVGLGVTSIPSNYSLQTSSSIFMGTTYSNFATSGGNSNGYIYGCFAKYADGIHMGYNFYNDNSTNHIPDSGGATSRLSFSFGSITAYMGAINSEPTTQVLMANISGVGIGNVTPINILDVKGGSAFGSYAGSSSAPTNGLIVSGNVGIGTSSPTCLLTVTGAVEINGNTTLPASTGGAIFMNAGFSSPNQGRLYVGDGTGWIFRMAKRNASVETDLFYFTDGGKLGIGDSAPGTTLSVIGNAQIGFNSGTTAPTNGLVVGGIVAIGVSNPDTSSVASLQLANNLTTTNGGYAYGLIWTGSFTPASGASGQLRSISTQGSFNAPNSQTINQAIGYYANLGLNTATSGTINSAYGILVEGGSSSGSGTISNVYSGYFGNPSIGTNKCALYADNESIGFTNTSPPSNGLIVNGKVGIGTSSSINSTLTIQSSGSAGNTENGLNGLMIYTGTTMSDYTIYMGADKTNAVSYIQSVHYATSIAPLCLNARGGNVGIGTISPAASSVLQLSSTTQGFLLPSMTTTQKNAISSPAASLQVYDSTLVETDVQNSITFVASDVNAQTVNTTSSNGSAWVPFNVGNMQEVVFQTGSSNNAHWFVSTGSITAQAPSGSYPYWLLYNPSATSTSWISYLSQSISVGVYKIEYTIRFGIDAPIWNFGVAQAAGVSGYVTLRTGVDAYLPTDQPVNFVDYIVITAPGTCDFRWTSNGKNASSTNYFLPVSFLRVTRLG